MSIEIALILAMLPFTVVVGIIAFLLGSWFIHSGSEQKD
mgnify:CR=1 FL=1